ncbi:uncharacterized protein LOC119648794 [Hermetia illucens]|nr:uncharacterized protein LOC119648794 [Hermetia illucens]
MEVEYPATTSKRTISFIDLKDDCMIKIFSYLHLSEILKFALFSDVWDPLIEKVIASGQYLDIKFLYETCPKDQVRHILMQFGPRIKELVIQRTRMEFYEELLQVADYFSSLEYLRFCDMDQPRIITQNFTAAVQNLKRLDYLFTRCDDDILSDISKWQTLEAVNFSCSKTVTGNHVHALKNVVDLNLNSCKGITSKAFVEICNSLKLKALNIFGCDQLDEASFEALVNTQTELESLSISHMYETSNMETIAQITSLKHLRIHQDPEFDNEMQLLTDFAEQQNDSLEFLEIYEDPFTMLGFNITDENRDQIIQLKSVNKLSLCFLTRVPTRMITEIAEGLPNLTSLNLMGVSVIDLSALLDIIRVAKNLVKLNISQTREFSNSDYKPILDTLVENNSKPILMNVSFTGFTWKFLQSPEYQEGQHMLKLSFGAGHLF